MKWRLKLSMCRYVCGKDEFVICCGGGCGRRFQVHWWERTEIQTKEKASESGEGERKIRETTNQ